MNKKDIHTLIRLARKCGESVCDKGTFEERQTKFLVMKWKYQGCAFAHKFPGSQKRSTLNHQYSQMRKNLRASGLGPPNEFSEKFMGSVEQRELLEELWLHLGTDDEGETPYGGEVEW
ncbi:MAG: hypothetical protein HOG63_07235 [Nitrospina sp.]|jgi:hypothetical protein|nr:hypothetical protein [Nitrospina sp.]MBT3413741.1 hypothetical protein [Nitrospina sp.]MBT3857039.1 hypothetical protein [Nitrospina sp.]MBT4103614.1 hypothetical protein [Nitrospina sp.]MBT4390940.1 hypothetical protein [Nitrospina sp.]